MHDSARQSLRAFFHEYAVAADARVLELGGLDVNGGVRDELGVGRTWVGVDLVAGPGVDVVLDDPYALPFPVGSFDVAVASSVLEHDEMFWLSFLELVRVVRPGGLVYLCSPSNGHLHRYPVDCYRFYPDAGAALARWAERCGSPVVLVESLVLAQQDSEWNDWVAVYRVGATAGAVDVPRLRPVLPQFWPGPGVDGAPADRIAATQDQIERHHLALEVQRLTRASPSTGLIGRLKRRLGRAGAT